VWAPTVHEITNPPITAGANKIIIPPTKTPLFSVKLTPGSTRLEVKKIIFIIRKE
jgi:hypothetical protein